MLSSADFEPDSLAVARAVRVDISRRRQSYSIDDAPLSSLS